MKRILSIALIAIYVIPFTEVHQLVKLPLLLEHFSEHRKLTTDLTFFEFLSLHYTSETAHDDRDMQLPFKDCSHCVISQLVVLPGFKIDLKRDVQAFTIVTYSLFYKKFIPASYLSEIWQPPKA